jgi:hypothetical protein
MIYRSLRAPRPVAGRPVVFDILRCANCRGVFRLKADSVCLLRAGGEFTKKLPFRLTCIRNLDSLEKFAQNVARW